MPLFCPEPCGRLATAAVFIAVGVVQLLVGVILLRSDFADLLSGADFLSSAANIFIGCLYGIAASVWQNNEKSAVLKRTARKNTLAALLITVITVNTTAVIVLIMSEGNELLSLPFFGDRKDLSSATFAKEVFTCAYVASVCSAIVCLVVALVALSGNCFHMCCTSQKPAKQNASVDKKQNPIGWVFDEKTGEKSVSKNSNASSQSSTSGNSVFPATSDSSASLKRKSIIHSKSIASPSPAWKQKRSKIFKRDSLSRKISPSNGHFQNHCFVDDLNRGVLPRQQETSFLNQTKNVTIIGKPVRSHRAHIPSKESRTPNTNLYLDTDYKKVRSDSYAKAVQGEYETNFETKVKLKNPNMINKAMSLEGNQRMEEKYVARRASPRHFGSVYSALHKPVPKSNQAGVHKSPLRSLDSHLKELTDAEDPEITRLKLQTLQELKKRVGQCLPETKVKDPRNGESKVSGVENEKKSYLKKFVQKQSSEVAASEYAHSEEVMSPGEVFEPNKTCSGTRRVSEPKDVSSIQSTSKTYSAYYPKPLDLTMKKINPEFTKSQGFVKHQVLNYSSSKNKSFNQPSKDEVFPHNERKSDNPEGMFPNEARPKLQNTKRETFRKSGSLASISEVPTEEVRTTFSDRESSSNATDRTSSLDESTKDVDENSNIDIHSSPSRTYRESKAVIKTKSFSPKSILKKMWSTGPEVKLSVSELIVDDDSLIGLSDEELLTRTLRIRSLRKVVEERLKKENQNKVEVVVPKI